jgi:hypothetical protein
MSSVSNKQSALTFQQIATKLPPDKLRRLAEIKKAYPRVRLKGLPDGVKRQVRSILQTGIDAAKTIQSKNIQSRAGVKHPADYASLFSVICEDLESKRDVVIYQKDRTQGL